MKPYDEENLTNDEVQTLIHELKNPRPRSGLQRLFKLVSAKLEVGPETIDGVIVVRAVASSIEYKLYIYCGDTHLNPQHIKYTIHLRFKISNEHLVRLDINGKHRNPDERRARTYSHLHVYTNRYVRHDRVAVAIDPTVFTDVGSIVVTLEQFAQLVNIEKKGVN